MAYRKQGFADGGVLYAKHLIAMENAIIDIEELINAAGGMKGEKGEKGDPFTVAKTYTSISEMNADFGNASIAEGSFVVIASDTEDADNAKLYIKGKTSYAFVTDMSGVQGFKGEPGITPHIGDNGHWWIGDYDTGVTAGGTSTGEGGAGIVSIERTYGDGSPGTTDIYTITLSDETTYDISVYNGKDGVVGKDGTNGITPNIGANGNWWVGDTDTGVFAGGTAGKDGEDGEDGKTPVKGEDYFTEEDKAEIVEAVIAAGGGGSATIEVNGILKGDGTGAVVAAEAGVDYAAAEHTQSADTITAGTLAGEVKANASNQTYSTYLLRNSRLASTDQTVSTNGEICWTYG